MMRRYRRLLGNIQIIFQSFCRAKCQRLDLLSSRLYNERTFYDAFMDDLAYCQREAVIESPFLTVRRVRQLLPMVRRMIACGVRITVNTRRPQEHEGYLQYEAEDCIGLLQSSGVEVLFTGGHHRKLVIFDRKLLYEGSLNIFSQHESSEIMRRIESEELARQMISFVGLEKFL
jgi:phosphatidylserine/phosphatidylglycerophosphate/cardiolipin synthase-like enzyme